MYVCICIYMYMYIYVYVYICMYVCMYVSNFGFGDISLFNFMYSCKFLLVSS